MGPEEDLFAARLEILRVIALFALARARDGERLDAVRAAALARAPEIEKVLKGMNHHAPDERSFWIEQFGHQTPAETFRLIERLPPPPGQKGRPKGTGYEEADLALMPEIHQRRASGETLKSVTEQLAATMNLASTQTEGAAIRLQRRYRQWRRTNKK